MDSIFSDRATDIFGEHIAVLVREVCGAMQDGMVEGAVDELTRLLAVSAHDGADAAREVVSAVRSGSSRSSQGGALPHDLETRLARVHALALESFARHRERIVRIREGELQRSGFVARRVRERKAGAF